MDTDVADTDLIAKLNRLDASAPPAVIGFGYETLVDRHAAKVSRARRKLAITRGAAGVLVTVLVAASVWRFDQPLDVQQSANTMTEESEPSTQPRIVRADNWL